MRAQLLMFNNLNSLRNNLNQTQWYFLAIEKVKHKTSFILLHYSAYKLINKLIRVQNYIMYSLIWAIL